MSFAQALWILAIGYVAFVALMECLIGFVQPNMDGGVKLTTVDAAGRRSERKLAGVRMDGHLYVASNHWLRGWYRRALANPELRVEVDGAEAAYSAIPVVGEERARIARLYRMGFVLRFICGFAPSKFLRLDPSESSEGERPGRPKLPQGE